MGTESKGADEVLAVERIALALFDDLLDVPESVCEQWIADRTADPRVKRRLAAMLEAERISTPGVSRVFGTGAAPLAIEPAVAAGPERIGRYRLLGVIGRGGMGTVYRAVRDAGDFTHEVAIKLIKPGLLSDVLVGRFLSERQTLADLQHANIARLYDGGATDDGSPYIVMELVEGAMPVDRWADTHALPTADRVVLVEQAAGAIAYAHQRLVVHRDVTPLNVLVGTGGALKLIDFGIARPAGTEAAATEEKRRTAPTQGDISALGRLLLRLVPAPEPELAAIAAEATAGRYPTADAFRDDLLAWRSGMPVAAMRGGDGYRLRKFLRRHRVPSVLVGAALAGLLVAMIGVAVASRQARRAEAEADARFNETRSIAKAMLFDVFDKVSRVSGATEARQALADTSIRYLDALAAMGNAPADVRIEAGRGYVRLAEVTGGGQYATLGRYADANALLDRAATLLEPAYAARPDDKAVALAFAALRAEQAGTDLYNNNQPARARARATDAEKATAPFATHDAEAARLHALAIQAQGDSYGWNDDFAAALPFHLRAEAFLKALPAALLGNVLVRAARSGNLRLLAEAQHKLKQEDAARATIDQGIAINRGLLAEAPDDPKLRRKLAMSLWYAAVVHRTNERDREARAAIAEAVGLARQMVARDPHDSSGLQLLALASEIEAQLYMDSGDKAKSYTASESALGAHRTLVELAGGAPGALRSYTATLRTTASNRYNFGDIEGACTLWRQILANIGELQAKSALTELDRRNVLAETRGFMRDICEGKKPKAQWPARM